MLREMGIPIWWPESAASEAPAESASAVPPGLASAVISDLKSPAATTCVAAAPAPGAIHVAERSASPPPVDRGEVARLDWPALREAVADCRACTLCESRQQTVFGVGSQNAHWMVVGEAPGEEEDRRGEPFVGKSGQLLDQMLRALGLTRADEAGADPARQVYIANTLKCRPPRNRNPEPAELAQCEPFLVRQIELLKPKVILAMGAFAIKTLLRSNEPVGKLRGRVHRYHGVPLIVSYHPAYLLRSPAEKARSWADLCLAADTAELPPTSSA
jgi:DNA polymerase